MLLATCGCLCHLEGPGCRLLGSMESLGFGARGRTHCGNLLPLTALTGVLHSKLLKGVRIYRGLCRDYYRGYSGGY